jgi:hypothetical protein
LFLPGDEPLRLGEDFRIVPSNSLQVPFGGGRLRWLHVCWLSIDARLQVTNDGSLNARDIELALSVKPCDPI